MAVKSDISPMAILAGFRGFVARARLTYPERAALDVTDANGGEWHLTTWWSDYSPADPEVFDGKTVVSAKLGDPEGKLTVGFSDGTDFTVTPVLDEGDDAIENWQLFTPEGRILIYGPRGRWQLGRPPTPARGSGDDPGLAEGQPDRLAVAGESVVVEQRAGDPRGEVDAARPLGRDGPRA